MYNSSKDEVIQTIKYGKKDYNDLLPGANSTPMCHPTVETNKRSYGPFPEPGPKFDKDEGPDLCVFGWEVEVPKNKNFNDWFNAEKILWTGSNTGIAGFHSEIKPI